MKKLSQLFIAVIPAMCLLAGAAHAADQVDGYAYDAQGVVVKDGYGECVKTGSWTEKSVAPAECGGPAKTQAKAEPAPRGAVSVSKHTIEAKVLFDFNKYNLKPAGKVELDRLAKDIKGAGAVESVIVVGHTDSVGSDSYNQRLSVRRANTVAKYLQTKGLKHVRAEGKGEREPVASNDSEQGRAQNRRVEIEVIAK